jgi:ABC-type antimicrobial peptide transport system permease subunit
VRIALGAARENIIRMILSETLYVVIIGIAVGVPSAMLFTRLLKSQLYQLSPHDFATMIGAVAVLLAVTFAAGLIPAKRAAAIDPAVALRHD